MDTNKSNYGYGQEAAATTPSTVPVTQPQPASVKRRGRPKVSVEWPNETFTFNKLTEENTALSSSSLRKKMRTELSKGGLVKVGTLKTAFGRPQDVYKKPQEDA